MPTFPYLHVTGAVDTNVVFDGFSEKNREKESRLWLFETLQMDLYVNVAVNI